MPQAAIEISGVRKSYGGQPVLKGVGLTVPAGAILALLGPNGAGKTTLVRILSTLVKPDAGTVRVAGFDAVTEPGKVRQRISLTGQFAAVDEVLTAAENLRMMGRLAGLTAAEARLRADELLERFGLTYAAHRQVRTFSGGMRRRLDLAISLMSERAVLFLDEPTTGLDAGSRRVLWDIVRELSGKGVTVLLTTQYLEEAEQLADRIAVLNGGRITALGTAEELKSRIGSDVIEVTDENGEILREIPTSGTLRDVKRVLDVLEEAMPAGARVRIRRPTMDDVFLALTMSGHKEELSHGGAE